MPVQRIPRYVRKFLKKILKQFIDFFIKILLLTEILKNTHPDHCDFANLVAATDRMKNIANILNEKVREAENVTKMIQITTSFTNECPVSF